MRAFEERVRNRGVVRTTPFIVVHHGPVEHATKERNHGLLRLCVGLERLYALGKTALALRGKTDWGLGSMAAQRGAWRGGDALGGLGASCASRGDDTLGARLGDWTGSPKGGRGRVRAAQRAQRSKDVRLERERVAGLLLLVLVFLRHRRDRGREPRLQSFQRVSAQECDDW